MRSVGFSVQNKFDLELSCSEPIKVVLLLFKVGTGKGLSHTPCPFSVPEALPRNPNLNILQMLQTTIEGMLESAAWFSNNLSLVITCAAVSSVTASALIIFLSNHLIAHFPRSTPLGGSCFSEVQVKIFSQRCLCCWTRPLGQREASLPQSCVSLHGNLLDREKACKAVETRRHPKSGCFFFFFITPFFFHFIVKIFKHTTK